MPEEPVPAVVAPVVPVPDPVEPLVEPLVDTAPNLEPDLTTPSHPLQPGGKRFEQVYAQSKQAQRERDEERDKRIRAEAQLEILMKGQTPQQQQTKEYTWEELEPMIATGQITRSDAYRHREEVLARNLERSIKGNFQRESSDAIRLNALTKTMSDYMAAVPDISDVNSPRRQRVDQEFDWLVQVQGKDPKTLGAAERRALEVNALRNVLGPVESLSKRLAPSVEPHQGSIGGGRVETSSNPDQKLLDALTPRQVDHYKRMIDRGKYKGWKDVVEEIKWIPPQRQN